jgi:ABC-type uncharacterized transport system auxiliary subunit
MLLSFRQFNQCLVSFIALLTLTACLSISNESDPVSLYRLSAAEVPSTADAQALAIALSINSSRLLDSQRLWVMQADRRVQPLADFRWAMPAPELFRQTLIETLESSGVALAVDSAASDGRLQLELRAMQIEVDAEQQAQARISVLASWLGVDVTESSQLFEVRRDATINSSGSAAAALDQASQQMMTELAAWLQNQSRK